MDRFLSGHSCNIYIDDKPIHGVKGFKFALEAGDHGPVFKLEFYPGEINIEGLTGDTVAVGDFMKDLLSM